MKIVITACLEKTHDEIDLHVSINEAQYANVQEVLMINIFFFPFNVYIINKSYNICTCVVCQWNQC